MIATNATTTTVITISTVVAMVEAIDRPNNAIGITTNIPMRYAMTPFFRTYPLLYHKFGNMVIVCSGNLYSLSSP